MDAKEFLKEYDRMCTTLKKQHKCNEEDCPIGRIYTWDPNKIRPSCYDIVCKCYSEAVDIVEEWSRKNPAKTRQSEFLKMFPRMSTNDNIIHLCPASLDFDFTCNRKSGFSCDECRKNYWLERIN